MYIPSMSDSSLWLFLKALYFWEIIILKSAPTLHLIYYARFETLFFICFGSFLMFIERCCVKRLFFQHCVVYFFFIILLCYSDFWTGFRGAYFRPNFAAIGRKFAARYFWFKAKLEQKKFIFAAYNLLWYHRRSLFVRVSRITRPSGRNWVGLYEGGVRYCGHCCFQYMYRTCNIFPQLTVPSWLQLSR